VRLEFVRFKERLQGFISDSNSDSSKQQKKTRLGGHFVGR